MKNTWKSLKKKENEKFVHFQAFPSIFHRKQPCECLRKQAFAGRFTQ
jgi:hypothetical protein